MKKFLCTLMCLVLSFSLVACSQAPSESTISGTIEEVGMSAVTIAQDNGSLSFSLDTDSAIAITGGELAEGAVITITYTGEIDGLDTSKCKISKIEVTTPAPTPELEATLAGTVTSGSSMNMIELDVGGVTYDLPLSDETIIDTPDGIVEGAVVTVYYTGTLSTDGSGMTITRIEEISEPVTNTIQTAPVSDSSADTAGKNNMNDDNGELVEIYGTVEDVTMHSVTINDGQTSYTFGLGDYVDYNNLPNGLSDGMYVEIQCGGYINGTDTSGCNVSSITLQ